MATDLVPPFADDAFRRVLCVVAHPDDVEYGISSAVASWTARGVDVAYLLLTRGKPHWNSSPPERTAQLRTEEQIAGSRAVSVSARSNPDHRDGMLEYGLDLRRDIARVIRRRQPDAVVVGSWEVEFAAGLNQADHRVAGIAALDALRDAGNRLGLPRTARRGPAAALGAVAARGRRPGGRLTAWTSPGSRWSAASPRWRRTSSTWPGSPASRAADDDHRLHRVAGTVHGRAARVSFRAWDFQLPADRGRDHGGDAGRLRGDARQFVGPGACRPGPELVGIEVRPRCA